MLVRFKSPCNTPFVQLHHERSQLVCGMFVEPALPQHFGQGREVALGRDKISVQKQSSSFLFNISHFVRGVKSSLAQHAGKKVSPFRFAFLEKV